MNIARTYSRERGAAYNQHHSSKQHREQQSGHQPPHQEEDAIEISLAALAAVAESGVKSDAAQSTVAPEVENGPAPRIDITV